MQFKNSDLALGALNDTVFTIAKLAHHGQTDQSGDEYFQHPVRVAAMARKEMPGNPYVFAVGMLHDVLEDTHTLDGEPPSRITLRIRRGRRGGNSQERFSSHSNQ